MAGPTTADAATALDGTELGGLLEDLAGFAGLPGIGKVLEGLREAAEAASAGQLTTDHTQTMTAVLAGVRGCDVLTAIGETVAHLTSPDTNLVLRTLPEEQQKAAQLHGENLVHHLADSDPDSDLHQHAAEAAGAIVGI